ncbi:WAT1-related protein [Hibiscus syriacus]|uniref:WAT1-related protein n=1 Tax=Hibiscus syriacus TaxID=106335 RepID=A0A6A3C2W5_HIBSY|nr:WAT1-related protein [Hibiscus syriacus]
MHVPTRWASEAIRPSYPRASKAIRTSYARASEGSRASYARASERASKGRSPREHGDLQGRPEGMATYVLGRTCAMQHVHSLCLSKGRGSETDDDELSDCTLMALRYYELADQRCQVKLIGTLISIAGIIVVELYRGPFIRTSSVSLTQPLHLIPKHIVFYSTPDRWILGGILLAAANLSISIWNIIRVGTVKHYPQVMKVASFYSLVGTIQCLGMFGSIIRSNVHFTCTRMKGPFYVPMFKPFGILFATIFGTSFFTNSLQFGSVIGTIIVGAGCYALMWGQIREAELRKERNVEKVDDISDDLKAPLLHEQEEEEEAHVGS